MQFLVAKSVVDPAPTVSMILLVAKFFVDSERTAVGNFLANIAADSAKKSAENFHRAAKSASDSIPTVEKFHVKTVFGAEETAEKFPANTAAGLAQIVEIFRAKIVAAAAAVGLVAGAAAADFAATVPELNHQQRRAKDLAVGS